MNADHPSGWTLHRVRAVLQDWPGLHRDRALPDALVQAGRLERIESGEVLITQGHDADQDVYFLLQGEVTVLVHGVPVAVRTARQHVGEMAAINPSGTRSATVVARQQVTALVLGAEDIERIADHHPELWRCFAAELARRLHQRGEVVERLIALQGEGAQTSEVGGGKVKQGQLPNGVITGLYEALIETDFSSSQRKVLLAALPAKDRKDMTEHTAVGDQLLSDLNYLNRQPVPAEGPSLLEIWLEQALARYRGRAVEELLSHALHGLLKRREVAQRAGNTQEVN